MCNWLVWLKSRFTPKPPSPPTRNDRIKQLHAVFSGLNPRIERIVLREYVFKTRMNNITWLMENLSRAYVAIKADNYTPYLRTLKSHQTVNLDGYFLDNERYHIPAAVSIRYCMLLIAEIEDEVAYKSKYEKVDLYHVNRIMKPMYDEIDRLIECVLGAVEA